MRIDYRYQLTAHDLRERFKPETIERHWDKITAILWRQKEAQWEREQRLTGRPEDELL